jgi:hypothetical protein
MQSHSERSEARTVKVIYATQILAFAISVLIYAH